MGAYLSEPNTKKESQDDSTDQISYGASSMQGWRLEQEDAHTSLLDFDEKTQSSLFAVYDGHGGPEVAQYCAKYLPDFLKSHVDEFREGGDLREALRKLFLHFDEKLKSEEAQRELEEMRDGAEKSREETGDDKKEDDESEQDGDDDDDDEKKKSETELLYDEATMPIEEVLKRYRKAETRTKKALDKAQIKPVMPSPNISGAARRKAQQTSRLATSENGASGCCGGGENGGGVVVSLVSEEKKVVELKTSKDFQKQEEIDINEIKKNSSILGDEANESMTNHEQDYDEASNLGEIIESQQKSLLSKSTDSKQENESECANKSVRIDNDQQQLENNSPKATKLNQEDLKLSPIRKKSFSSSSMLEESSSTSVDQQNNSKLLQQPSGDDDDTANATTTTEIEDDDDDDEGDDDDTNDQKSSSSTASNSSSNQKEPKSKKPTKRGHDDEEADEKELEERKKKVVAAAAASIAKKGLNISPKSSNRIAKFIADCVNKKLACVNKAASSGIKGGNGGGAKKKSSSKNKAEEEAGRLGNEEEEDDEDYEGEEADDDDDEEEDEEEEEDEDGEDDEESDDDEDDDDDDDDEDEDDDDDDEDDEDYEDEDEDEDMDVQEPGFSTGPSRPGYDSGCTAVLALLVGQKHLYVANAGDSRCVVCRDGKAVDMSEDHKPEDEGERTRIEKAGGTISKDGRVNNGLNLSRAIGDHSYKLNESLPLSEQMITSAPDVKYLELDLQRDKFMVLACDGIWNFMSSQEVCDYISERLNANYAKLSQICEELFMHCLAPNSEGDGTGCDNMTCIIVTFAPFRKAVCKLPASIASLQSNSLKRAYENGNGNGNANGVDASANALMGNEKNGKSVGGAESGGDPSEQTTTTTNEGDEKSSISKKLKQENGSGNGELRPDVTAS